MKRTFQQTGFKRKDNRAMARTRRAVGVTKFRRPQQSIAFRSKISSIEHKFYNSSVSNVAISHNTSITNVFNDPVTGGIFTPQKADDIANREGRRATVDEIYIRGHVLFPSAEAITDIALSGQAVRIVLVRDKIPKGSLATTSDIYTNATGTEYGNISAVRNPNSIQRFHVYKNLLLVRPQCAVTQFDATSFSQTSAMVPFEFYVKHRKPVVTQFNSGDTTTIASIEENSYHIMAWTGGDDSTVGVNTRMDCTLTYNARVRFYG